MRIYEKLEKNYNVECEYIHNGTKCYLDKCRNIFVQAKPEEKVRQQIVRYLEHELNVPKAMIETEVNLKDYGLSSRKRIDIVINEKNDNGDIHTVAIVECKSNDVELSHYVYRQAKEYADCIDVNYFFITNGIDIEAFYYDEHDECYYELTDIPKYENIISNDLQDIEYYLDKWVFERTNFKNLSNIEYINENYTNYMIGEDTSDKLKPFILNLGECFLDTTKKFRIKNYKDFRVIDDYGVRYLSHGNASGGSFNTFYRTLIIEDSCKNHQIISFCVSSTMKCENHPIWGNSTGKSVLIVSIDDLEKRHNSLELNLNKFLEIVDNKATIKHNGVIAVGNIGSGKSSELKEFVKKEAPELLNEKGDIILGNLSTDKLLYMNQNDVEDLVVNLIKYSLIRDKYRVYVKQKRLQKV